MILLTISGIFTLTSIIAETIVKGIQRLTKIFIYIGGYRQTIFTRYAPSIRNRIEYFDQEFENLLKRQNIEEGSSREAAVAEIEKILDDLKKQRQ